MTERIAEAIATTLTAVEEAAAEAAYCSSGRTAVV